MPVQKLLSLFPLDLVLVPGELLPLHIFEPRYRALLSRAEATGTEFGIVRQRQSTLERTGCAAKVRQVTRRFEDGRFNVVASGTRRFLARSFDRSEECVRAVVEFFEDDKPAQPDAGKVRALVQAAEQVRRLTGKSGANWDPNHPWLSFRIAGDLPVDPDLKQALLEMRGEVERVERLTGYLLGVLRKRARKRLVQTNGNLRP